MHRGEPPALPILILAALLCLPGCSSEPAGAAGAGDESSGPATPDLRVRRGEIRRTFLLTGELEAVTGDPILVPRCPSWQVPIRWILDDGAEVVEGDPVVELDTTEVIGDLEQKRIAEDSALHEMEKKQAEVEVQLAVHTFQVETARATLRKAEIDASIPRELVRLRQYQENQLALEKAQAEYDKAVGGLESYREASQREMEILRIALEKARREIEAAQRAIDSMVLKAPRAGLFVVGQNFREGRKYQVGDSVWVGLEVAQVPDLTRMRVKADLADVDDDRVLPGMPAVATLDTYPNLPVPAVIRDVGPVAQEVDRRSERRRFRVEVGLESSDPEIMRPGMSVRVEVETASREDVLVVPRVALEVADGEVRALLAGDGERVVELGLCNAQECEISGGLDEGERLRGRS